jgi:hypothetical protein
VTHRDLAWKATGVALFAGACTACLMLDRSPLMVPLFIVALLGLPLMIHGKRVAQVFRAERRGHYHTATAVHAARVRRRGQNSDGFGL